MNYAFIDLHIHTKHSHEPLCDDTVEEVLTRAQKIAEDAGGRALIAITDHNTILGIQEARNLLDTGRFPNVDLLPGAEFTVDISAINTPFSGKQVLRKCHILAYGFDEHDPALIDFSYKFQSGKRGVLDFDSLCALIGRADGKLILAHPGLIKIHHASMFKKVLDENGNAKMAKKDVNILRNFEDSKHYLEYIFGSLSKRSKGVLVGMERFHPDNYAHDFDQKIEEICTENNLVQTAGSDFHGYHLHTDFSVGNVFTKLFQEFYKCKIGDCTEHMNALFVTHLPNIEVLTGKGDKSKKVSFGNAEGQKILPEQYEIVVHALGNLLKADGRQNTSGRNYLSKKKSKKNNLRPRAEYKMRLAKIEKDEADRQIKEYI